MTTDNSQTCPDCWEYGTCKLHSKGQLTPDLVNIAGEKDTIPTDELNLCPGFACLCYPIHNSKEEHDAARTTEDTGKLEQHIRFIVDELGSPGNDMWHDASTDWWTARVMERITAHDRARLDAVLEAIGPGPQPTNIPAIPETDDYANGWNDCRKAAHSQLQNYRAQLRTAVKAIFKMEDGE